MVKGIACAVLVGSLAAVVACSSSSNAPLSGGNGSGDDASTNNSSSSGGSTSSSGSGSSSGNSSGSSSGSSSGATGDDGGGCDISSFPLSSTCKSCVNSMCASQLAACSPCGVTCALSCTACETSCISLDGGDDDAAPVENGDAATGSCMQLNACTVPVLGSGCMAVNSVASGTLSACNMAISTNNQGSCTGFLSEIQATGFCK